MTEENYKQLDRLDNVQNVLLALALYDNRFFNDSRVYELKDDYGVKASNKELFTYYYGRKEELTGLNYERYRESYENILANLVYL